MTLDLKGKGDKEYHFYCHYLNMLLKIIEKHLSEISKYKSLNYMKKNREFFRK